MNVAIIPARGGSKRLPNKNIKLLAGKPLIVWTIEAAIDSQIFDMILVSTDSESIADIARKAGAIVPFIRPAELASDIATTNDVVSHAVEWIEMKHGEVSRITILQPTSPLRKKYNIVEAHELYERNNALSIISVCQMDHSIQLCNKLPKNHSMSGFIRKESNVRGQDLEPYHRINGAIYIFDRGFVGALSEIYDERSFAYVMEQHESIDIDQQLDFEIAEVIMSRQEMV